MTTFDFMFGTVTHNNLLYRSQFNLVAELGGIRTYMLNNYIPLKCAVDNSTNYNKCVSRLTTSAAGSKQNFRLNGGKLSGDSEARLLAKERIFDGWMSIVSALYIT